MPKSDLKVVPLEERPQYEVKIKMSGAQTRRYKGIKDWSWTESSLLLYDRPLISKESSGTIHPRVVVERTFLETVEFTKETSIPPKIRKVPSKKTVSSARKTTKQSR